MKTYSIPRHIWRAIYPVLIFFGLSVVVAVAGMIVIMVIVMLGDGAANSAAFSQSITQGTSLVDSLAGGLSQDPAFLNLMAQISESVARNAMWVQLATNAVQIAVLLPLFHFTRLASRRYASGLLRVGSSMLIFIAAMGFSITMSYLIGMLDIMRFFPEYETLMMTITDSSFLSQLLAVGIIGPIAEEICFRGLVHTRLSQWLPGWAAAVISGLLFGIIHLNLIQGVYAFIFGVGLSLVYMKFKTIWAPIIGHIGFNIISILLDGFITATGYEIPDAFILIPSVLAAAICTFMIVNLRSGEERTEGAEEDV